MLIFDSQKTQYRSPFGPVRTGETVRFSPILKRRDIEVKLRLWVDGREEIVEGEPAGDRMIFLYTPAAPGLIWYYFIIDAPDGRYYFSGPGGGVGRMFTSPPDSYQLTVHEDYRVADWFCSGIAYQIFPDRFYKPGKILGLEEHRALGHTMVQREWGRQPMFLPLEGEEFYSPCDIYGGNLYGVIEKLPYLASLGVSCIYLNPVMLSCSNHRYNISDYMKVDPILGGCEALKELADAAAGYGIKLMLDGVFSHTGDDSVYFDRYGKFGGGACSDPDSPYREWYQFTDYPKEYKSWWGFKSLPEVDESNSSYMEFIAAVMARYASLGITSWRLDVADELPDGFIAFLKARLRELDPESVLLGEVWEDASNKQAFGIRRKYVDGAELDSVMCYPFRDGVVDFFLGRTTAGGLRRRFLAIQENYPEPFYKAQLNLLGSHDTVRAFTALGGAPHRDALSREEQAVFQLTPEEDARGRERLMSAAALQFAMPGVPCIYYGDEAGMKGMADPFNRGAFPWGEEDNELTEHYRALGRIRSGSHSLKYGCCAFAAPSDQVFALCRGDVICAVNRAESPQRVTIAPWQFAGRLEDVSIAGRYTEALSGAKVSANGALEVTLPPLGRAIYIKD